MGKSSGSAVRRARAVVRQHDMMTGGRRFLQWREIGNAFPPDAYPCVPAPVDEFVVPGEWFCAGEHLPGEPCVLVKG